MTDLTRLTIAEARTKLRAKEISAAELTESYLGAIDAANPHLNAYVAVTADKARAMAKASDERLAKGEGASARGHPARHQGSVRHRRRPHPGRQPCARRLQAALRIDRVGQSVGRRRGHARQAQHGRVRHGLVQRDLLLRPGRQSVAAFAHHHQRHAGNACRRWRLRQRGRRQDRAHAGQPAAGAGRLVGRLGRRRSRRSCALPPPPPTPAARSASRPPSPAPSASSRPMAAARAGASSPSPPRSTRPARSPATCATRRSC